MECKKVFQELVEACESALRFLNQLGYEGGSPLVGPMQLRLVLAKARTIIPCCSPATNDIVDLKKAINLLHADTPAQEMESCLRKVEASLTIGSYNDPAILEVMLTDVRRVLGIKK